MFWIVSVSTSCVRDLIPEGLYILGLYVDKSRLTRTDVFVPGIMYCISVSCCFVANLIGSSQPCKDHNLG